MIETAAIERFFALVKRASQARSKDIRIDLHDAMVLSAEISTALAKLTNQISPEISIVSMDGGRL